jgi:hypothetical protein
MKGWGWWRAQVVGRQPNKCDSLSSNPSKKKKKNERMGQYLEISLTGSKEKTVAKTDVS